MNNIEESKAKAKETKETIARNRASEIERRLNHVERKLKRIQDMRYDVQEFMVSNEEHMENLQKWSNQLEERVLCYDVLVDKLKNQLRVTMKREDQEKMDFRRWMEELQIKKKKLIIQKKSYEIRGKIVREERYKNLKLPKMNVTKF